MKEQVRKEKIRKEIGKEMTWNTRYVVQWGYVGGKLIYIIEESRKVKRNMEGLRRTCVCEGVGNVGGGVGSRK